MYIAFSMCSGQAHRITCGWHRPNLRESATTPASGVLLRLLMVNCIVCGELARPQNDEGHTAAGSKCGCPATQPLHFGCTLWVIYRTRRTTVVSERTLSVTEVPSFDYLGSKHLATPSHSSTAPEASFLASLNLREHVSCRPNLACCGSRRRILPGTCWTHCRL